MGEYTSAEGRTQAEFLIDDLSNQIVAAAATSVSLDDTQVITILLAGIRDIVATPGGALDSILPSLIEKLSFIAKDRHGEVR